MTTDNNNQDYEAREEDEVDFDFWSDEGAKRFNEALDEGAAYSSAEGCGTADSENDIDDQESEYRDPELCDPNEEALPPGEMELIFENSFIM